MASKFIALSEESTFGTATSVWMYFKLLTESINTTREDFYPDTTSFWVGDDRAEGLFRTSGDAEILMDPVMWPKLLVLFIGDGSSTGSGSGYAHTFKFGVNEVVATTGIKPFTTMIGTGIERDRQIAGGYISGISIEAVARDLVTTTISITGSGNESLETPALTPSYTNYTQPYLTFISAETMTVGGTDRLTTAPTIEAFRLNLTRGYDADHYVLGNRFLGAQSLSGMATVEGSMDFSFTSQDEHERFLAAVGTYSAGDQASFAIVLNLRGAAILTGGTFYQVQITIPEAHYTASTVSVTARDRIIQTVDFRGIYNSSDASACKFVVTNLTTAYSSLT